MGGDQSFKTSKLFKWCPPIHPFTIIRSEEIIEFVENDSNTY
ncbi:hypothetical protein J2S24_002504 [Thermoanaerobacter pentosaceus]|uniref:Uncharacterized protein n=1 Tax=Thermoanaerobacter pentosaceus TaxID=694059 RepID=A0ABT9M764_9THEO|nr:hypothetical protein [Thermoanaerobacter pentosaceus]